MIHNLEIGIQGKTHSLEFITLVFLQAYLVDTEGGHKMLESTQGAAAARCCELEKRLPLYNAEPCHHLTDSDRMECKIPT